MARFLLLVGLAAGLFLLFRWLSRQPPRVYAQLSWILLSLGLLVLVPVILGISGMKQVASIVTSSGPRLEALHWPSSPAAVIDEGDFMMLGVSGWAGGYAFDLSRVGVPLGPTAEQLDYLQHLAEATAWMLGRMQPGERLTYYPAESRGRMIDPLAHGIGLECAEKPWVRVRKPFVPQAGMVLCVVPVVASEDFGQMAIKEMVAIRDSGPQVLGQV